MILVHRCTGGRVHRQILGSMIGSYKEWNMKESSLWRKIEHFVPCEMLYCDITTHFGNLRNVFLTIMFWSQISKIINRGTWHVLFLPAQKASLSSLHDKKVHLEPGSHCRTPLLFLCRHLPLKKVRTLRRKMSDSAFRSVFSTLN